MEKSDRHEYLCQLPESLRKSTERVCTPRISGHLRHGPKSRGGLIEHILPSKVTELREEERKRAKIRGARVSLPAASVASYEY